MKRDLVDLILQLTYLEGRITTKGLIEKVMMKRAPVDRMSIQKTEQLHDRLIALLDERKTFEATKGALTLGEYLTHEIASRARKPEAIVLASIAKKSGIAVSQLTRLCRDTLSPLEIPAKAMNVLLRHYALPLQAAVRLIQNSIRCANLSPSLASTLARYDARYNRHKSKAMQKAVRELFVKADIHISPNLQERINEYVKHATDGLEP
jgi:hypothetical protein